MALANEIRRYRFDSGEMTQKELAGYVGVSRQTINAIEGDKYPPSLDVAFKIADVFGASIEDVFLYVPDDGGLHEFADGLVIGVTWDEDENENENENDDSGGN